ncbi:peroxisome assembly protein 12 [Nephila pilipes]|uniref:Peroxisome assembly protein 12 n=1 Tax=Nephila pilipes TaxID=299642 RepID=A0A8X6U1L1_NEPPI|nr:peroxisome assembly protein 12 [Nephila pilipes]
MPVHVEQTSMKNCLKVKHPPPTDRINLNTELMERDHVSVKNPIRLTENESRVGVQILCDESENEEVNNDGEKESYQNFYQQLYFFLLRTMILQFFPKLSSRRLLLTTVPIKKRMAEYGIHHATFGRSKPSIFEIIGQENLIIALRSAFRHGFKVLAENYPEKFGTIFRYFDEGYTVVDSVFQYIHLRLKGGLFPETFYGLKRIPDPRSFDVSKRKIASWVFLAVVFPYLQSQMELLYKNIREEYSNGNLNYKDFKRRLALLYLKFFPIYNFFWEITVLGYYMAFALNKTRFHSPLMHVTSTTLTHLTMFDLSDDAWKEYIPESQQKKFTTALWSCMNIFVGGVTLTISVGAFLTQFINWWYYREGNTASFAALPVPPPPSKWSYEEAVDNCPLCKKKRTNDTVLSSSGFVFCYPCIFHFVQENRKCPVTGYKSSLNQLVRLYLQEE